MTGALFVSADNFIPVEAAVSAARREIASDTRASVVALPFDPTGLSCLNPRSDSATPCTNLRELTESVDHFWVCESAK